MTNAAKLWDALNQFVKDRSDLEPEELRERWKEVCDLASIDVTGEDRWGGMIVDDNFNVVDDDHWSVAPRDPRYAYAALCGVVALCEEILRYGPLEIT